MLPGVLGMTNPLCPKRRVALLLLLLLVVVVRKAGGKQKCFHEEIRSNVTGTEYLRRERS